MIDPNQFGDDDLPDDDGGDFEDESLDTPPVPVPAGLPLIDGDRDTDEGHYDPLEDRITRAVPGWKPTQWQILPLRVADWNAPFNPYPGGE